MTHRHEFERAYPAKVAGRATWLRASLVIQFGWWLVTDNDRYRWLCRCGEEGVLMRDVR